MKKKRTFFKVLDLKTAGFLPSLAVLSVFFICGAVAGSVTASYISGDGNSGLLQYVSGYVSMVRESGAVKPDVLDAFVSTFKYHLAAFLIGFTSIGFILIPFLMAARGFFLSFAVTSFVRIFGLKGLLLSLGVFGFQCMLTLPCLFLISVQAFASANSLFLMTIGKKSRNQAPIYGGAYFTRVLVCCVVLVFCSLFEAYITPAIVSVIAAYM